MARTIPIVAPPNPYRCPLGPYERVSMMAHVLKAKGYTKSKICVIDPKDKFSKQAQFMEGRQSHYPGIVEWLAPEVHGGIKSVDVKAGKIAADSNFVSQTAKKPEVRKATYEESIGWYAGITADIFGD